MAGLSFLVLGAISGFAMWMDFRLRPGGTEGRRSWEG